jgi:ABC-type lipoprotein release transport system permease subunit
MNPIVTIALRNLLRQKRRNILLGTAIAFGMMILMLANSFSHGISDVIFNKILKYTSGHISVSFSRHGNFYRMIFKDGDRMKDIVRAKIPDLASMQEAIGIMARVVGNGANDNVIMVGMDPNAGGTEKDKQEAAENFKMLQGSFYDINRTDVENPVLIAESKAKSLNIKLNDILRVRYQDVNGQNQAGRLTVVGIFKPANVFMATPIFLHLRDLKKLGGYGPHDIGQMYIMLKTDPRKNAKRYADTLHAALEPTLAAVAGTLRFRADTAPVVAVGYKNDSLLRKTLADSFAASAAMHGEPFAKDGVALDSTVAAVLGARPGDTCVLSYAPKYDSVPFEERLPVTELVRRPRSVRGGFVLVNEKRFYHFYYDHWPRPLGRDEASTLPEKGSPLYAALAPEWMLLKRTYTTQEAQKQTKEISKLRTNAFTVKVQSMYESASMVVNLEVALNLVTLVAVMVLFFIILIGVVNTLRMTIRERTREIGTVRAIGMQKNDVRNSFVLETFFLTLFAVAGGIVAAFVVMAALSLIKINTQDNPMGMLLVNGHLNFAPTVLATVGYTVLILLIAAVTAYFPARRAANLSAAAAFRHYE